jgi:hypothetical protein
MVIVFGIFLNFYMPLFSYNVDLGPLGVQIYNGFFGRGQGTQLVKMMPKRDLLNLRVALTHDLND